ncbi:hypothetical protein TELCIR_16143 [Teladorsagia circumcincta]|uniref:G-protein coupled receptors family 1 profile domain-containing protein n=1 Tax=Teladorsagia circumcincta TaxID=45464 RepID=A0A2G9TWK7_TELCI|nr:hypothetical protein TELCIR_16143 [Teladorsagia circumcincta]
MFLHSIASAGTTPHKRARLRTFRALALVLWFFGLFCSPTSASCSMQPYHLQSNSYSSRQRFSVIVM